MSDKNNDNKQSDGGDDEQALQEELRREAAEGKGSVGDASRNSNLSGSSTWETLPEGDASQKDDQ